MSKEITTRYKPKASVKKAKGSKKAKKNYVKVSYPQWGKKLLGIKIYFEGKQPDQLKDDGQIYFGKAILEILLKTFDKFHWHLTVDRDEIEVKRGITRVYTSLKTLRRFYQTGINRKKGINEDIVLNGFAKLYPSNFTAIHAEKYNSGHISKILCEDILNDLSSEDKEALNKFIPSYVAKESMTLTTSLNATVQIKTLKALAAEMEKELTGNRTESWWQDFIQRNILLIQQGYIAALDKMNIAVGNTKFPDFSLVTHDNFLDILEIKKPTTELVKEDTSRNNFFWDTEISKALIQVENYIHNISRHGDAVRNYIKDNHGIELKVVRPRGIVLAGNSSSLNTPKKQDDFRLLTQGNKNILFLTYDELVTRLQNFISVLEEHSKTTTSIKPGLLESS